MVTVTKAELTDVVCGQLGVSKRESKELVDAFFAEIAGTLARGDEVKLANFGNFKVRDKPQRPGRNPKTGVEVPITARRVVTFHASAQLKNAALATELDP
jgi:integration host factor subunit alpha